MIISKRCLLYQSPNKKTVFQFHYNAWPDHGTPEELGLVQFHRSVIKKAQSESCFLVHCRLIFMYLRLKAIYSTMCLPNHLFWIAYRSYYIFHCSLCSPFIIDVVGNMGSALVLQKKKISSIWILISGVQDMYISQVIFC